MRPRLALLAGLLSSLFLSCDDSFSPKGPFETRYFLYTIVNFDRYDKITLYAIVNRSYDVEGLSPLTNTTDPFVDSVTVTISVNGRIYTFEEQVSDSLHLTRFGTRQRIYRANRVLINARDELYVSAAIPGGPVISGHTTVPGVRPMTSQPTFVHGFTTKVSRFLEGDSFVLDWNDGIHDDHLFFPSLTITYIKYGDADTTVHSVPVPMKYVDQGGTSIPVYPSPGTTLGCSFALDAIDRAMREISEGDADKSRYAPLLLCFSSVEYDLPLSRYYSSANGSLDQYSLRLDQTVYTNVQGGGGIVGATSRDGIDYPFDPNYLATFGYRTN